MFENVSRETMDACENAAFCIMRSPNPENRKYTATTINTDTMAATAKMILFRDFTRCLLDSPHIVWGIFCNTHVDYQETSGVCKATSANRCRVRRPAASCPD
jgi:hypothetical protein